MAFQKERDHRLNSLGQIKDRNKSGDSHWFDPDTIRYFSSRVSEMVYPTFDTRQGTFFVSSEKGPDGVRSYTVRRAVLRLEGPDLSIVTGCDIHTVGGFQWYASRNGAHAAAKRLRDRVLFQPQKEWS